MNDSLNSILMVAGEELSIEIIAVDDCSNDGSYEMLVEYANSIPELKVYKNDVNKGVSYTRNRMMELANGKYITFVDSDDYIVPQGYQRLYDVLEQNDADASFGQYKCIALEDSFQYNDMLSLRGKPILSKYSDSSNVCYLPNTVAPIIYKSELIKEIRFCESMCVGEDTLFSLEASIAAKKVMRINDICYCYRMNPQSVMHAKRDKNKRKKIYESHLQMLQRFIFLKKQQVVARKILDHKIHHSKENVIYTLMQIDDLNYIKQQMKLLKNEKLYPYPFRKEALMNGNLIKRLLVFTLPIKVCFWLNHFLFTKVLYKII